MKTFEAGDEILKEGEATKEALTMCRKSQHGSGPAFAVAIIAI